MGKKIYNFDDFVNESYVSEGLFSWFKKNVMDRLTGWTKSFYQALENGLIKTIPSGPKKGKPVAMLFVPENGPIDKQIAEFYGTKANESQEIEEAVVPLEYTEEDQSVRNINAEDLMEEIMELYEAKVSGGRAKPIFIYGAPGIGKTQIVGQAATSLGVPLLNLDLQFMGPEDFIGVPVQVDIKKPEFSEVEDETTGEKTMVVKDYGAGFTRSNPPSILPRDNGANGKGGIIFMDEANRANPIVLRSLMQFVQMGRIGDYQLPTKWIIVAAGNRPAEAEVAEFDFAFADRFTIVNYVPELGIDPSGAITGGWAKWASSSGKILPELIYFLADNRELFHRLDTEKKVLNYPTPRSWADGALVLNDYMRNKGLSSWRDVPAQKIKNIFFDQVGPQAAGKFADFLDILRKASDSDIEEMLTDPDGARIIPEFKKEKRFLFGLIQTLINKVPDGDAQKLLSIVKYISRYGQYEVLTWLLKRIYDKFPEFGKFEASYKDEPGWEYRKEAVEIVRQGKKEQGL
jgi:hypothetical protein